MPLQELIPGARAGLEPATIVVNADSGCIAAATPRGGCDHRAGNLLRCKENRGMRGCRRDDCDLAKESPGRPSDAK
jgi:hypothetical protein